MSNFAHDMRVKTAWGMSLTKWNSLPEHERAYCREHVTTAPYFQENK